MSRTPFQVAANDTAALLELVESGPKRLANRARIVLLSSQGMRVEQIATELDMVPPTIYKWRRRYAERGMRGLYDLPRPGQPQKLDDASKRVLLRLITEQMPDNGLSWSIRNLAHQAGITEHQARRLLQRSLPPLPAVPAQAHEAREPPVWLPSLARVAGVCVAPPLLAMLLLVNAEPSSFPPLLRGTGHFGTRIPTHYRKHPKSLYRAFDVSSSGSADPLERAVHLRRMLRSISDSAPPGQRLQVVAAPTRTLDIVLDAEARDRASWISIPAVHRWLAAAEELLRDLEHVAYAPELSRSELQLLRDSLERHNRDPTRRGSPFIWKNAGFTWCA